MTTEITYVTYPNRIQRNEGSFPDRQNLAFTTDLPGHLPEELSQPFHAVDPSSWPRFPPKKGDKARSAPACAYHPILARRNFLREQTLEGRTSMLRHKSLRSGKSTPEVGPVAHVFPGETVPTRSLTSCLQPPSPAIPTWPQDSPALPLVLDGGRCRKGKEHSTQP